MGNARFATLTETDLYFVPAVGVDNDELAMGGDCGARFAVVSKVTDEPE